MKKNKERPVRVITQEQVDDEDICPECGEHIVYKKGLYNNYLQTIGECSGCGIQVVIR
jgi:hypothetical protein